MTNRLVHELSPYLLQHAENPVDWWAWGDDAFEAARTDDKPIFLSIGYSTCHWCHVMEHESFENDDVAGALNRGFVCIKVDREERPDIDRVYMAFVQASTGSGGWPMSVWLTPDLKPFFGGTYFPPSSRYGRPGFVDILQRVSELWTTERQRLVRSANELMEKLRRAHVQAPVNTGADDRRVATVDTLRDGTSQFVQSFDGVHAGFGTAPKFPRPSELIFLMREYVRTGDTALLDVATRTLAAMADGGMRDHLGGGFHRYSVDAEWRIPHFEKMLYDQAQLTVAYLEAGQCLGDARLLAVASDTLRYVSEDLTGPEGGFLSAEDADSLPPAVDTFGAASDDASTATSPAASADTSLVPKTETSADTLVGRGTGTSSATGTGHHAGRDTAVVRPVEGAFYLWRRDELDRILGDDAALVAARFGVEAGGNAPHDPTGELAGLNQFYLAATANDVARDHRLTVDEVTDRLRRASATLLETRNRRPRPHRDDKVLAAWNGLMIGAAARAAHVNETDAEFALRLATRAATFVQESLWDPARRVLRRRYRQGHASVDGYCEDYAFMVWGLLELFQTTGEPGWLTWARVLQRRQDELFWDDETGGWFSTTGEDPSVLMRVKDEYDGAEPSAGSISVLNLLTMVHLFDDPDGRKKIEATLARFGSRLGQAARVVPLMTTALAQFHEGLSQVVVVGPSGREDTERLRRCVASHYLPFAVRLLVEPGPRQEALATDLPFVGPMRTDGGRATAYVCSNFSCREPVTEPEALDIQLRSLNRAK